MSGAQPRALAQQIINKYYDIVTCLLLHLMNILQVKIYILFEDASSKKRKKKKEKEKSLVFSGCLRAMNCLCCIGKGTIQCLLFF